MIFYYFFIIILFGKIETLQQQRKRKEHITMSDLPVKHRGRPKGSKNTVKTHRKDNTQEIIPSEDRQRIVAFNNVLLKLPRVNDRNNAQEIQERITFFLTLCQERSVMPTVAGLALALGVDRTTLWSWMNNKQGEIKNREVIDILKNTYFSINSQYEMLLTEGKMIPVSAFFLMQNNFGYKQQTDHVIKADNNNEPSQEDISNKAGLLD